MATRPTTIAFILEQAAGAGVVSARKMFGEYTVYCDGKVVALVCDDQLFVKPTRAGRDHIGTLTVEERPPYDGAKPCLLIPGERWDDGAWLSDLIRCSAEELPRPKPRRRASAGRSAGARP